MQSQSRGGNVRRPVIVIPTNRTSGYVEAFLRSWKKEFDGADVIIVEDRKEKILQGIGHETFDWNDIDNELKEDSWIIPRGTDCVRSFGFLKALERDPLFIVSMDDDVRPHTRGLLKSHYENLTKTVPYRYISTMKGILPRGSKYDISSKVAISHGGWVGVPDLDADTQIHNDMHDADEEDFNEVYIPSGTLYSMCGMNVAFKPEVTKLMYFGLQGREFAIDRCGDIWAGFYAQSNLPYDMGSHSGEPYVEHNKASNIWTNLHKERNAVTATKDFLAFCDNDVATLPAYFKKLEKAYDIWGDECQKRL